MDNEIQTQFPILSYVLSTLDPNSHPPQLSQTLIQYPHLSNPTLLSSLAQSIPPTTPQSLTLLRTLGPLPDPESVSSARSKLTQMEKTGENSKEAEIYKAVVRMEEMQLGSRKQLEEAEEMLFGAYSEGVKELEGGCVVDGVVEAMLKEVENDGVVERLDLSGRQLRLVPEAFGRIGGLVVLKLSRNQLEILPDSIDGLGKLEELDVSSNLLQSLPDSIGLLHKLKVLHVSGNKLTALPESIALCSSLVELDASFNNLVCLPTNFGCGLGNLEQLSIQLNKIRLLPPSICEMKSLRYLDAHFNEIHGLPSAIGRLTNLEVLNLSSNFSDLTELPETTSDLVNLRVLDLSNNQIRALPDTFGRLENLTELNLDENPLIIPPREIVHKGVQAVREFMAKRWQDLIAKEQRRRDLQANQEQPQTGWLAWGTGLLNNFVSGVSERVSGYLGGAKTPIDPHLDEQLL